MMYYRKALKLQAFLDMAEDDGMLHQWSEFSMVKSLRENIIIISKCDNFLLKLNF